MPFEKWRRVAAIGTILGASVLLARIAIGDRLTLLIGIVSLGALFRWKIHNALLILKTASLGIVAYPCPNPAWVTLK